MLGRRGPGLVRVAATTAVVAGTAGAVSHHQQEKYAGQAAAQEAAAAPVYAEEPPPEAAAEPAYMAELEQLAQLKAQGILTEDEFQAKKKQLLGI
jgi:hypothetical protein